MSTSRASLRRSSSTSDTMVAANGTAKPGSRRLRRYSQVAHSVIGHTGKSDHANVFAMSASPVSAGGWLMFPTCQAIQPVK